MIDEELHRRLYDFVKAKYEGLRGGLSVEVQNAIAHWLNEHGLGAHTKTRINPGMPRVQARVDAIISWLREHGFLYQFTLKDWENACMHTVGHDPRTIRKYLELAKKFGRIKPVRGNVWEIV